MAGRAAYRAVTNLLALETQLLTPVGWGQEQQHIWGPCLAALQIRQSQLLLGKTGRPHLEPPAPTHLAHAHTTTVVFQAAGKPGLPHTSPLGQLKVPGSHGLKLSECKVPTIFPQSFPNLVPLHPPADGLVMPMAGGRNRQDGSTQVAAHKRCSKALGSYEGSAPRASGSVRMSDMN